MDQVKLSRRHKGPVIAIFSFFLAGIIGLYLCLELGFSLRWRGFHIPTEITALFSVALIFLGIYMLFIYISQFRLKDFALIKTAQGMRIPRIAPFIGWKYINVPWSQISNIKVKEDNIYIQTNSNAIIINNDELPMEQSLEHVRQILKSWWDIYI